MRKLPLCLGAILAAATTAVSAQTVSARLLLELGAPAGSSTITVFNPVFTDGDGRPGSLLELASGARAIWYDGAVVFDSSTLATPVLSGGESSIGIGNGGAFVYSPNVDGEDALWTHRGLLLRRDDVAPGLPGQFVTFSSRPGMLPDGSVVVISGFAAAAGGATLGRVLYRSAPNAGLPIQPILKSGDLVEGVTIGAIGISFNYQMSDNGQHLIVPLLLDTGSTATDGALWVNGQVLAREGSPVGASMPGENWEGFAGVAINNAGNWLLAGDSNGPTTRDAFLAYRGTVQVREGDLVNGEPLSAPAAMRAASIDNRGRAVYVWNTAGNARKAFFAADASNLADARVLLKTGSTVDLNGDCRSDGTVIDIFHTYTSTFGVSLAEDESVYFHISFDSGGTLRQGLVRLPLDPVYCDGFEG
jgi:hypothetical protein